MEQNNNWCVYKHTCPNGKVYIGITSKQPKQRWKNGKGYLQNKHFTNAIAKYGWQNIKHEIIINGLSKEEACKLEIHYISLYQANNMLFGYNRSTGGEFPAEGFHHTEESKAKISKAFKGRFVGELNPMYGVHNNHICDETGCLPEKIKEKISEKAKIRMEKDKEFAERMQSYNERKMKPVNQYDLDGNYIRRYKSRNEAFKITGICPQTIYKVCKRLPTRNGGVHITAGGYQWRFSDDCCDIGKCSISRPKHYTGEQNHNAVKVN